MKNLPIKDNLRIRDNALCTKVSLIRGSTVYYYDNDEKYFIQFNPEFYHHQKLVHIKKISSGISIKVNIIHKLSFLYSYSTSWKVF